MKVIGGRVRLHEACPSLREAGIGVLDIGARDGMNPVFTPVAPLLDVVGFEPDAEEAQRLQVAAGGSSFRSLAYLPYGLGEADGERVLNLCRLRGTSSLYTPNRHFLNRFPDAGRFDVVDTAPVPIRSLDSLRQNPAIGLPRRIDFIKIDTQGSELQILLGARQLLQREVIGLEVEVLFAPLYDGQPVFRDIDAFLSGCGFTLFKLRRQEWVRSTLAGQPHLTSGQLVFGDALYLKDPVDARHRWAPEDARQLEALVIFALLYDLHDFALEILQAPDLAPRLDAEQLRRFVGQRGGRLGSVYEWLRMAKVICGSRDGLRRYAARWARGDGNFYSVLKDGMR